MITPYQSVLPSLFTYYCIHKTDYVDDYRLAACGHSFCYPCLRAYFAGKLHEQANDDTNGRRIPLRLRRFDPLRVTPSHLSALRHILPRSNFRCPVCRAAVSQRDNPISAAALRGITSAINRAIDTLNPPSYEQPVVTALTGSWEGLFRI